MAYGVFARYYDALTANVQYKSRAVYFDGLIKKHIPDAKLLLDLACGTGSLSFEMSSLGYDIIGVDASPDMLSVAAQKNVCEPRVLFLNQAMQDLELYGTVDAAICALDSLNHLTPDELSKTLERLRLFIAPGGVFIFDVNTEYKHREVLAGSCFVYELDDLYCIWQSGLLKDASIEITLDFFERSHDGSYIRHREQFCEYLHEDARLRESLTYAGFKILDVFEADTQNPPGPKSERIVYVAIRL